MKHLTQDQLRCLEVIRFFRADPQRWTQGAFARDENGHCCLPESNISKSFCFVGAWQKLYGLPPGSRNSLHELTVLNDDCDDLDDLIMRVSGAFGV